MSCETIARRMAATGYGITGKQYRNWEMHGGRNIKLVAVPAMAFALEVSQDFFLPVATRLSVVKSASQTN